MTKQELINTYDSMSMPEEHVEAIEARLKETLIKCTRKAKNMV